MEAAVILQGLQVPRGSWAGSEATPGEAPRSHETCRGQSKWTEQGREHKAERPQTSTAVHRASAFLPAQPGRAGRQGQTPKGEAVA